MEEVLGHTVEDDMILMIWLDIIMRNEYVLVPLPVHPFCEGNGPSLAPLQ